MRRIPNWLFLVGIMGLVASTALCSVVAYAAAQQFAIDVGDTGVQVGERSDFVNFLNGQPTSTRTPTPPPTQTPPPGVTITAEPTSNEPTLTPDPLADLPRYDDPRRLNILLLGIDEREGFTTERAYRSDTMMLISVNPVTKQVGVLSLPRDLWVDIPGGYTQGRINTANYIGDNDDYPGGGGPALAAETVQQNFGIKVDKWVRINFDVFNRLVDTLAPEGIEVCITEAITDDAYPDAGFGIMSIYFDAGCQKLNAERLLQYARTRRTQGGDFDRARRQQQVLKAAQAQFLSVGGITNFITQIPTLWDELSGSVQTNLTVEELMALGGLATEIKQEDITMAVIDTRQVTFAKAPDGADILIPNYNSVRILLQEVFNPQPPATLADLRERAEGEAANVVVYNNTAVTGLASKTQEWLIGKIEVDATGNIPEPMNTVTVIRDYGSHPWTARYLAKLLNLPDERIEPGRDGLIPKGVMLVVGSDVEPILSGAPIP